MSEPLIRTVRDSVHAAKLRVVYARYAKTKGWNDHPMAVRQRVQLYLETGTGPLEEALAAYATTRRRWAARLRRASVAACIVTAGVYIACRGPAAAAGIPPGPATQSSDHSMKEEAMPRSGLEPETR